MRLIQPHGCSKVSFGCSGLRWWHQKVRPIITFKSTGFPVSQKAFVMMLKEEAIEINLKGKRFWEFSDAKELVVHEVFTMIDDYSGHKKMMTWIFEVAQLFRDVLGVDKETEWQKSAWIYAFKYIVIFEASRYKCRLLGGNAINILRYKLLANASIPCSHIGKAFIKPK